MVKRILNIFLAINILKKLDLYAYSSQKLVQKRTDFDETKHLSFSIKNDELLEKYTEIIASKKNLVVNLYIMTNI